MRILVLLSLWLVSLDARAQSYLDQRDAGAIGVITRSLAKIDKVPALFDGTAIPPGADLQEVRALLDQLSLHLKAARLALGDLSAKGAQGPDVQKLRIRYDDLERYRAALAPAFSRARSDSENARDQQKADDERAYAVASKVCVEFRAEMQSIGDTEMRELTYLADGQAFFWQTVEDGARYKRTLERTAALCNRLPTAGASCARAASVEPLDARYCATAARADELMKAGVKNLITHHVKSSGPADILNDFERINGFLAVDGVIGWTAYFTGAALKERLAKQVLPLLAQANMTAAEGDALFSAIAKEYAALEAKARQTAPTWDLPGAACSGPGCAPARKFVQQWYRGSTIKRFQHTQPGWKILTNDLGVPTYRERYGFALVQVKGDPFCQLRMWTLSEQYAGGGRYTAARGVHLHLVRWQTCK